jgi:hypothetical protein
VRHHHPGRRAGGGAQQVHRALLDSLARFDNLLIAMRLEEEKLRVEKINQALELK